MVTSSYFIQYLKRIWWLIIFIIAAISVLLSQNYFQTLDQRQVRAVDAAISAQAQIELLIEDLRRSSAIFTLQYASLIHRSAFDRSAADELQQLVLQYFNNTVSLMVTNEEGSFQLKRNKKSPGEICKHDIQRFIIGLEHEVNVHSPPNNNRHFDIPNKWGFAGSSGVFIIIFDIEMIADILNFHQPENHRLLLVDKFKPNQIEVTIDGKEELYHATELTDQEYKNTDFNSEINGTRWSLLVIQDHQNFISQRNQNIIQIIIVSGLFLLVIVFGLWRLSKETNKGNQSILKEQRQKQQQEEMLHSLVAGTSGATGDAFFFSLVKELANYMQVDNVFIALKQSHNAHNYSTLANWSAEYYVKQNVIRLPQDVFSKSSVCYVEENFEQQHEGCLLNNYKFSVSGFLACQLFNNKGEVTAVLVVLSHNKLTVGKRELAVMQIFAARAEAEIDRKAAEKELIEQKERAQISLESIADGVITTNNLGMIDFMNPVAEQFTGWSEELAMGQVLGSVFHLEDEETGELIPDPALHCMEEKRMISPKSDNVLVSKNTDRFSIQGSASPMFGVEGDCIGAVVVFNDVTLARQMEKAIAFQASHDALTGLVNRTEFERRLESAFQSAKDFEHNHVLLYLDLDQFKIVNDTAGHIAGDELLVQIANLLLEQLRSRDTLGRLGGDEFSVLLEHCPVSEAKTRALKLIDSIKGFHFIWEKKSYQVGVSIGLVAINSESLSTVQILTQADLACYTAKDKGRGQAHVYQEDDAEVATRHRELLRAADLKQCIEKHRFELLYQPIIALKDDDSKMHGEVLLRLLDENDEHVLPGAFIPAAERYGIMDQIDKWVLNKIFSDYSDIFEQNKDLLLSINLSGNSFSNDSLLPFILDLFAQSNINPQQICFEITETSAISSYKQLNEFIRQLKTKGCSFALDDFGSGLSSFTYLKTMDVDYLKIDGHFIKNLCDDEIDREMVKSINEMGHILGIKTIAEYADDENIIILLKQIGVDYAQGYYLGELVPMDTMTLSIEELEEVDHPLIN